MKAIKVVLSASLHAGITAEQVVNGQALLVLSFAAGLTHRITMPIRAEDRWLYPIDWEQISATIRFDRAGARCEQCGRPHLTRVAHLGDGRWWDSTFLRWRNDRGRRVAVKDFIHAAVRTTYVVLACAHLDHDPANSMPSNLRALCQRCHIMHDAAEHRWRRWWNAFRLRGLRDLYEDPRVTRERTEGALPIVGVTRLHLTRREVFQQAASVSGTTHLDNFPAGGLFDRQVQNLGFF